MTPIPRQVVSAELKLDTATVEMVLSCGHRVNLHLADHPLQAVDAVSAPVAGDEYPCHTCAFVSVADGLDAVEIVRQIQALFGPPDDLKATAVHVKEALWRHMEEIKARDLILSRVRTFAQQLQGKPERHKREAGSALLRVLSGR